MTWPEKNFKRLVCLTLVVSLVLEIVLVSDFHLNLNFERFSHALILNTFRILSVHSYSFDSISISYELDKILFMLLDVSIIEGSKVHNHNHIEDSTIVKALSQSLLSLFKSCVF